MLNALWIFIGGGLGILGRWRFSGFVARHWGETFPVGTLVINVSGSFVIGLFAGLTGPDGRWLAWASFGRFLMLGICGGYTLFHPSACKHLSSLLDEMMKGGLVALEKVRVIDYRANPEVGTPPEI